MNTSASIKTFYLQKNDRTCKESFLVGKYQTSKQYVAVPPLPILLWKFLLSSYRIVLRCCYSFGRTIQLTIQGWESLCKPLLENSSLISKRQVTTKLGVQELVAVQDSRKQNSLFDEAVYKRDPQHPHSFFFLLFTNFVERLKKKNPYSTRCLNSGSDVTQETFKSPKVLVAGGVHKEFTWCTMRQCFVVGLTEIRLG